MSDQKKIELDQLVKEFVKQLKGQTYEFCDELVSSLRSELQTRSIVSE